MSKNTYNMYNTDTEYWNWERKSLVYSELFRADTEIFKFTFVSFHQAYTVNEKVT